MDPYTPNEIFSPYPLQITDSKPDRTKNTTAPEPEPHMVSRSLSSANGAAKNHPLKSDSDQQNGPQTYHQALPSEIQHLLVMHLAGNQSPKECLATLRKYAMVSRVTYAAVQHVLAQPEFLQVALHATRYAVPELAILPWNVADPGKEFIRRITNLASAYPQLCADLSHDAKVPRRTTKRALGWLPSLFLYRQPFSNANPNKPIAVKALLGSDQLTFLQLRIDGNRPPSGFCASDDAVSEVCVFLSAVAKGLQTKMQLHLECRFISPADAADLLHRLSTCAGTKLVRGLNLQGSLPEPDSAERSHAMLDLINFLTQNSALRQLNLSDNQLTPSETIALANALKTSTGLTELHLNANQLGEVGAIAIAALLESGSPLRRLVLENNHINGIGAEAINVALKSNTTLEQIYLTDNPTWGSSIWKDQAERMQSFMSTPEKSMPPMKMGH